MRDAQDLYIGSVEVDPMGPVPRRAVILAPPQLAGAEVARWTGTRWEVLAERPPTPVQPHEHEMNAYLAAVRELRERILNRLAGIGAAAIATADQATVDAFLIARQRLLDITQAPAVLVATDAETLKQAIKDEYASIVGSAPPALVTAFDEMVE